MLLTLSVLCLLLLVNKRLHSLVLRLPVKVFKWLHLWLKDYTGQLGVTQQEARQGFEQVAQILPEAQRLGAITPGAQPVGLEETTTAVFGGESSADYKQRIRRLAEIEQSRFAGQSGVSRTSLTQGTQGQF
jgi:hypothetical protein